jgi:thioesterase domain-containing protein
MDAACEELQSIWWEQIPISRAMSIEIVEFAEDEFVVAAALDANINLHGTAFAGSLYAVCALTGWGMIWLQLRARQIDARIVVASASIDYKRSVAENIVCKCQFDEVKHSAGFDKLKVSKRARFPLRCTIETRGRTAVRFDGRYAAHRLG